MFASTISLSGGFQPYKHMAMGVGRNFSRGATSAFCLSFFRFLTMQCKCMFTKRFALSYPQRKCSMWRQQSKMRFVGRNSQVYCHSLHNSLPADFESRALLYKEALPWSLMKLQIVTSFYLQESSASLRNKSCKRLGTHSQIRIKP